MAYLAEKARGPPSARVERPVDADGPRRLRRPAGVVQTGTGPGKGPSVCPCLLPQHGEPRNKGTILSYLMLPSPAGSARWQGHQGVSIHYLPPTSKSSGAECWGGGCYRLCCHGYHPDPKAHKKRALTPTSRRNLGLPGTLPLRILPSTTQSQHPEPKAIGQ